jgi:cytoplasmic iron level regulating protein YaaA (DUF328/UPF0246 family)
MLLLLPPSETKRSGGTGKPLGKAGLASLSFANSLGSPRQTVLRALAELSEDENAAAAALKLGKKSRAEIAHNRALTASPTTPAIERYTGVLFDELGYESLNSPARTWIDQHVALQSALFGLVRATDMIPAYRLSADSRLPGLPSTVKRLWRSAHEQLMRQLESEHLVLDLRSQSYADLAPVHSACVVNVIDLLESGAVRSSGHFNKATKGRFVRALAQSQLETDDVDVLLEWAAADGFDLKLHQKTISLVRNG